jgi:hypothetical protein
MQPVTVANEVGDSHVMISSGLAVGDQVVTEGQFRLKPGSKVRRSSRAKCRRAGSAELDKAKKWKQGGGRRGSAEFGIVAGDARRSRHRSIDDTSALRITRHADFATNLFIDGRHATHATDGSDDPWDFRRSSSADRSPPRC